MGMMENGQVESNKLLMGIGTMLRDEPHFMNSLLYGLIQCVMTRYQGNVNAHGSEKMVAFCQVLHSLSSKIYEVFRKNICGYNPQTLRRKATQSRATSTIFVISEALINHRVSLWIDGLKSKELLACTIPKKIWLLSVAADATKIPGKVKLCEPYGVWVVGIYTDHIVPQAAFDPDLFVSTTLAHELKVVLIAVQDVPNGLSPMKIIAACPQTMNGKSDEFNRSLLECCSHRGDCHVASISFDGLSTENEFIVKQLVSFMDGRTHSVGSVDPNHTAMPYAPCYS
jgi:hypothetical protein